MKAYINSNVIMYYLLLSLFLLIGCTPDPKVIQVSAAASMGDAAQQLIEAYQRQNPGVEVKLHLAASGTIASQISQGAPVDLFISASERHMQRLKEIGYVSDSHTIKLCSNSLVLVTHKNKPLDSIKQLAYGEIRRIGIGSPDYVPAGRYADEVLKASGMYLPLKEKLVFASSVRQVLTWTKLGLVDAGFVYRTDAELLKEVRIVDQWDTVSGKPMLYSAALVTGRPNFDAAISFLEFLQTDTTIDILEKYGFRFMKANEEHRKG